ncbi:MAG TPA: hypothetical protein VHE12_05795 [bacterium]|nr:hypothetical protein [bacterium]
MGFMKDVADNFSNPYATGGMLMDVSKTVQQGMLQGASYGTQASAYSTNASLARLQAQDAVERGKRQVATYARAFDQGYGEKYASAVGAGVDPTVGSALAGLEDYQHGGALDVVSLRNNASKEAFGLNQEADQYDLEAEQAKIKQRLAAGSGLLTGGMKFINFGLRPSDNNNAVPGKY